MNNIKPIMSLLLSFGLLLLANGLFSTILSIRTKTEGFPGWSIGIILSGYFAGLFISSFFSARVIASIGHIRAFGAFASIASSAVLFHLLIIDPFFWGILRVVSGFCIGGMIVVTEGWLNEHANNKNRGQILSVYMVTTYACAGSTQLIMMLGDPSGVKLYLLVSILFSLALIPILMTKTKAPLPSNPKIPNIKKLYKTSPVGIVGSFVVGFVNSVYYALAPIFAYSIGMTVKQTSIFIALGISSGMLLQIPLGKISDLIDRRIVIAFSSIMTTIACYLLYIVDISSISTIYLLAIFYGCVAFSINPICSAHTNDLSPQHERVQTSSALLMMYGIGAILGPITASQVITKNPAGIFMVSGLFTACFAIYTIFRLIVKPRNQDGKKKFVPFSVQSPARKLFFIKHLKTKNKNK